MSDDRPIVIQVYGEDGANEGLPIKTMYIHPDNVVTEFGLADAEGVVIEDEAVWFYPSVPVSRIVVSLPPRSS